MFGWDFARSAEAFFSRWAIKRVCKFLLKKKLGDFIIGDIDLDQLEVQLTSGTIQLSDLAVNVDYINQKLAGAALVLKEGSIASLSIKIPWKLQNCQIELEELELVLAPFMGSKNQVPKSCSKVCSDKQQMSAGPDKVGLGTPQETCGSVSLDIHEGVKTIAKIVKWILTSFHVRLKNIIVAFDPCLEGNENRLPVNKSLVLRIAETEFGACLSEDVDKAHIPKSDCLLGMARLTNFVKFENALIEVLVMTNIDRSSHPLDSSETLRNECSSSHSQSGSTIAILTSRNAGISGKMNLSIPWKNGSLDVHKIDASISFDLIELRLQPSTIEWIIFVWESIRHASTTAMSVHSSNLTVSSCSNSRINSDILSAEITTQRIRKFSDDMHFNINCKTFSDDLVTRTNVIQNWVPLSFTENQTDLEQGYGASIDQFFECFDGWRSSMANSGTKGLWNWTCSVFSAISVASNVASGSDHMFIEHFETCLRATVEEFSLLLYFHDEEESVSDLLSGSDKDANEPPCLNNLSSLAGCTRSPSLNGQNFDSYMSCFSSVNADQSTFAEPNPTGPKIHHLDLNCQDVVFIFQIGSLIRSCQISVKHFKIDEYYNYNNHVRIVDFSDNSNPCDQILINKTLKQKVLAALAPFPFLVQEYDSETSVKHNMEKYNGTFSSKEQFFKVGLMESFGDCNFHCVVSLADSDGSSASSSSFSVHLPPCILWFHFHLADSLLNLFKKVETYFKKSSENREDFFDDPSGGKKLVFASGMENDTASMKTVPAGDYLQGNFVLSHTRIIICFPMQIIDGFGHLYPMENFIILEHYPLLNVEKNLQPSHLSPKHSSAPNSGSCTPTLSLHFDLGTFDVYLSYTINKDATADQSVPLHMMKDITAVKVLSVTNRTADQCSGTTVVWQKGPVTGPWMASRVWSMASIHDHRSREVTGKDCEFSSVAAVDDFEEISSDIRQDLVLSSEFLLQLRFSNILLNLCSRDYKQLNYLLDIVMHGLSNGGFSNFIITESQPLSRLDYSQATIIMDCDILNLCISISEACDCTHSVQMEPVHSWNCFRLIVERFEVMCVSNIGGISATNFFRLIHGEGRLWGSIFNGNGSTSVTTRDVLLVSCMNSASRRGCGDGVNVLSFGSAGTTITYLHNPQLFRSYTSILIHCIAVVAPGGRLDWISDLCSFFSLPSENKSSGSDVNQSKPSLNLTTYEASFFLDLVDAALSYEPHFKHPTINGDNSYVESDDTFEANRGVSEELVGCLLAASSFSLSNHTILNSRISDYNIHLQDLGLLICQTSGLNNDYVSYDVSYLQKAGYVKVASGILLVAVLKIHGLQWEVECSDSHISFYTCHDTTDGLFRLIAQLQKLYAPDMEDALSHMQSRWNNVQQSHATNGSNYSLDYTHSSPCSDAGMKLSESGDSLSIGLLDGIIENAFYMTRRSNNPLNPSVIRCNDYGDGINPNSNVSTVNDNFEKMSSKRSASTLGVESSCSTSNSGLDKIGIVSSKEEFFPQLIESYYFSEIVAPSLPAKGTLPVEGQRWQLNLPGRADEHGKGGWYKDGCLMIVDNHIPNSVLVDPVQQRKAPKLVSVDSDASANCSEKGNILLKNIDVRWRMFAGSDWSEPMKSSTGKDGSLSLELILSGLSIHYAVYPDGEVNVSKLSIHVQDFNLCDLSTNAPWRMVIGHYNSKDHPRESYAKAFKLDLDTVRPDPQTPLEDYRLCLELLPIRLHLDQSQINFLISFFGDRPSVEESSCMSKDVDRSCISLRKSKACGGSAIIEEALLPFFQKCDVKPLVVRVDYIPHHMDLTSLRNGNYIELLNLVPWKGIDLQLKQVCAVGLYGWASVCETVVGQWLEDISHNQVHKLLKGLAPVRSLVSVAAGTSKLVTLPVKSYRRDKKFLKGMQRGAIAFVKSISLEAVGLGVHLASGAHEILLQTEYILTNVPPNNPSLSEKGRIKRSAKSNQPEDVQEGIQQAYQSLSDGLSRTASGLLGTPIKAYQRGAGAGLALATAVCAAPAAAIAPVTASAHAVHCALLGIRNSLDPEHKKESMNKYLGPSQF